MFECLCSAVEAFQGRHIAVVGDLMLDSHIWGNVDRISPEAPVPVVKIKNRSSCPGGAANVMRNIVTLGGEVRAFGITGADNNGEILKKQLLEYGIVAEGIRSDASRPTTSKQRIISASQQLLRIDEEESFPVSAEIREQINQSVISCLKNHEVDVLVLEDYVKGVLQQDTAQELVDAAYKYDVKTILDPNPKNAMVLHCLSIMKPNRSEAVSMSGIRWQDHDVDGLKQAASRIIDTWDVKDLVISLAGDGMALFRKDGTNIHIPTRAREVYDVSGAGDTVVATFALVIASGCTPQQTIELGNFCSLYFCCKVMDSNSLCKKNCGKKLPGLFIILQNSFPKFFAFLSGGRI